MKLTYEGQEKISASKQQVWDFVRDPEKVAYCLPDVEEVNVKDDKNFDAKVKVGIGPVRGKFKFQIALEPKPDEDKMVVKLRGGGLGTVVDLEAGADIKEEAEGTLLDWNGEAVVRGPAATVGGRVLDRKAKELITHVFAEVKRNLDEAA